MVIKRIINNSVISALDADGIEIVVMGNGIGFGKKKGEAVDEGRIEKIFHMENEDSLRRFKDLLSNLPLEYIEVSNEVIAYAKKRMGVELNQNVYITLTDHISFAIERFKEGMLFQNALHHEIKRFYPVEYSVGMHALELIAEKTGIKLPEDEAASIALHLVNAEFNMKIRDTWVLTNIISRMMDIMLEEMPELSEDSLDKDRILSNLKFLAYRCMMLKPVKEEPDSKLFLFMKQMHGKEWDIAEKIGELLLKEYNCRITKEEKLYLAIDMKRISDLYGDEPEA